MNNIILASFWNLVLIQFFNVWSFYSFSARFLCCCIHTSELSRNSWTKRIWIGKLRKRKINWRKRRSRWKWFAYVHLLQRHLMIRQKNSFFPRLIDEVYETEKKSMRGDLIIFFLGRVDTGTWTIFASKFSSEICWEDLLHSYAYLMIWILYLLVSSLSGISCLVDFKFQTLNQKPSTYHLLSI